MILPGLLEFCAWQDLEIQNKIQLSVSDSPPVVTLIKMR